MPKSDVSNIRKGPIGDVAERSSATEAETTSIPKTNVSGEQNANPRLNKGRWTEYNNKPVPTGGVVDGKSKMAR